MPALGSRPLAHRPAPARLALALALAAALVLAAAGCEAPGKDPGASADDGPGSQASGNTSVESSAPVQLRRVIEARPADALGDGPPQDCDAPRDSPPGPEEEVVACDEEGGSYRLAPAEVVGGLTRVRTEQEPRTLGWRVLLDFDPEAAATIADLTAELAGSDVLLALLLDGEVLTAVTVLSEIPDGRMQIAGGLELVEARALAAALTR